MIQNQQNPLVFHYPRASGRGPPDGCRVGRWGLWRNEYCSRVRERAKLSLPDHSKSIRNDENNLASRFGVDTLPRVPKNVEKKLKFPSKNQRNSLEFRYVGASGRDPIEGVPRGPAATLTQWIVL